MSLELHENIRAVTQEDQKRIINDLREGGLTYSDFQEKYDLSRYQGKKAVGLLEDLGIDVKKKQET